jgi:uncharacterized protein YbjQ (UPF0145 family)
VSDSGDSAIPGSQHLRIDTGSPVPAMPVIRDHEKHAGVPHPLSHGTPRVIGWEFNPPASGGPQFVIIAWSVMGGLKVLERFPLTEEGWRGAWQALSRDPRAAEDAAAILAARAAEDASAGTQQPEPERGPMLIVTTNEVPGHRIIEVHGDVFGLIVQARNYFSNLGASFRTVAGGEVAGYTKLLTDSRNQARERMWREARARGANAVVAMRFDCNEIGDLMSEVVAYGTAVTVEPESPHVNTIT